MIAKFLAGKEFSLRSAIEMKKFYTEQSLATKDELNALLGV